MSRRLFEVHGRLMRTAADLLERCSCPSGCPGCVGPGFGEQGANKRAAALLLDRLVERAAPMAAVPA